MIRLLTFDSFVEQSGERPEKGFIKLDVQGVEPKVLQGMRRSLKHMTQVFVHIEIQEQTLRDAHQTPENLIIILRQLGFYPIADEVHFVIGPWSDFQIQKGKKDYWFSRDSQASKEHIHSGRALEPNRK